MSKKLMSKRLSFRRMSGQKDQKKEEYCDRTIDDLPEGQVTFERTLMTIENTNDNATGGKNNDEKDPEMNQTEWTCCSRFVRFLIERIRSCDCEDLFRVHPWEKMQIKKETKERQRTNLFVNRTILFTKQRERKKKININKCTRVQVYVDVDVFQALLRTNDQLSSAVGNFSV